MTARTSCFSLPTEYHRHVVGVVLSSWCTVATIGIWGPYSSEAGERHVAIQQPSSAMGKATRTSRTKYTLGPGVRQPVRGGRRRGGGRHAVGLLGKSSMGKQPFQRKTRIGPADPASGDSESLATSTTRNCKIDRPCEQPSRQRVAATDTNDKNGAARNQAMCRRRPQPRYDCNSGPTLERGSRKAWTT